MKPHEKVTLAVLLVFTAAALAAVLATRGWINYRQRFQATQRATQRNTSLVDTAALDTAQNLASLAVTHRERDDAQEALRLGDYSADLAFSIAAQEAANHPAPMTPAMKALADRLKTAQEAVDADQALVSGLNAQLTGASVSDKDRIQAALAIISTQLSLDQDDAQDAQQQLIRAGGDQQAVIQQLLDQHNASETHTDKNGSDLLSNPVASPESSTARNILAQARAFGSLRAKKQQLLQAQQEAQARAATLGKSHDAMVQSMEAEKSQSRNSGDGEQGMAMLQRLSEDQKETAAIAKRLDTEQQLAALYGNWAIFVDTREKARLHEIFVSTLWIFLILLAGWGLNLAIQRAFGPVAIEKRQLHTMRSLITFFVRAVALIVVLLVVFGMPGNLGTVLALTTAGFTVAMQDFILGFFGWFILMGRDGIRPGDWVEINGVAGEVLGVSIFHTVLLETGTGTDAGHPTGRKVSFMNNYAIQGHYFNFSTSGQWMWDEIEVQVLDLEPYAKAEAIQKIVTDLTAADVHAAESEWGRATSRSINKSFSVAPATSIRPAGSGVTVSVRYITRASQRFDMRSKIYRAIVELLHNRQQSAPAASAS